MQNLLGKTLISVPHNPLNGFDRTIIFIYRHDANCSMGLVVNRVSYDIKSDHIFDNMGIEYDSCGSLPVFWGGPNEIGRGFVLHSNDYNGNSSLHINKDFYMTSTSDILKEIAKGKGPRKKLLCLGYTVWEPGSLENELKNNFWFLENSNQKLLFAENEIDKWSEALKIAHIDPVRLMQKMVFA